MAVSECFRFIIPHQNAHQFLSSTNSRGTRFLSDIRCITETHPYKNCSNLIFFAKLLTFSSSLRFNSTSLGACVLLVIDALQKLNDDGGGGLDYGNAARPTLYGLPGNQIDRLQSVMNAAARLVLSARKYTYEHVTPLLRTFIGYGA